MLNYPHRLERRRIVPDTAWPRGYSDQPDNGAMHFRKPGPVGIVMMMSRPPEALPPLIRVFEQHPETQLDSGLQETGGIEQADWQESRRLETQHVQLQQRDFRDGRATHALANYPPHSNAQPATHHNRMDFSRPRLRRSALLQRLLPKSGLNRTLCFGEFRQQLLPQLAHPDRLRNSHRLSCSVQVYRLTRAQPPLAVARKLLGAAAEASQLLSLTPTVAQQLRLPTPLQSAAIDLQSAQLELLPAGALVVQLTVLHDHTQDADNDAQSAEPQAKAIAQPRATIPEIYLKPWEFQLTREEALFDMGAASSGGLAARLGRFLRGMSKRNEFRRWRALLNGSLDEQLWTVHPPRGALTDPIVREWAEGALARAGYEVGSMLREWELYWRRKGL